VEARLSGASLSGAVAGSSSVQRLDENVRAVDVALTADDLDRIERVSAQGVALGARYDPAMLDLIDQ
jgi:aryl-alcohol dehydrogenase-like predicted oxidoreductase